MKTANIFAILEANKVQQGGTIHQIAEEAKKTADAGYVNGLLCYTFRIIGNHHFVNFDGCVDGRLIAEVPDPHIRGIKVARQVVRTQKEIIEAAIL